MTCALAHLTQSDNASIGSGISEVAAMPASNLLAPRVSQAWRSAGASGFVSFNYAISHAVQLLALLYHTGVTTATIRWRAATSEANLTASPVFDSGIQNLNPNPDHVGSWPRRHSAIFLSAAVTAAWWRFDFANLASPIEAGRVAIAGVYQPGRGIDYGDTLQTIDRSTRRTARSGANHVVPGGRYREVNFQLSALSRQELLDDVGDLERNLARTTALVWCRSPEATSLGAPSVGSGTMYQDFNVREHTIYGTLEELSPTTVLPGQRITRKAFRIVEEVHP